MLSVQSYLPAETLAVFGASIKKGVDKDKIFMLAFQNCSNAEEKKNENEEGGPNPVGAKGYWANFLGLPSQ